MRERCRNQLETGGLDHSPAGAAKAMQTTRPS
jgi:hypothetical protein